jgi:hypothetical protein
MTIDRAPRLAEFTTEALLAELLRREDAKPRRRPKRWCDNCRHFKTSPKAGNAYNPCQKGQKMDFLAPQDHSDLDDTSWGFYRIGCIDRIRGAYP